MGVLANLQSLLGIALIPLIAWILSEARNELGWRQALRIASVAIGLQIAIAVLLVLVPQIRWLLQLLSRGVAALQEATNAGTQLVFGYLAGGSAPFETTHPENGFVLALQALPLILLVSVLSRLLYHWGVLQRIVGAFAYMLERTMGIGGALGTSSAANIFVGMVEAPLLIRPFLRKMGRGPLFAVMTVGMATVAGTVMVLYASLLEPSLPGATGHILIASIISAPGALALARIMVPTGYDTAGEDGGVFLEDAPQSAMDAVARGTQDGLKLLAYVTAMLIVMVALVALANLIVAGVTSPFGLDLTVERTLGWFAAPLAFVIGVPWGEAIAAGELIGIKTVLNELLAYLKLAATPPEVIGERSRLILTYALCGFANFGSLGIMTGGLVAMCPERYDDIVKLGPKTIISGTLTTLLTGAIIGLISW